MRGPGTRAATARARADSSGIAAAAACPRWKFSPPVRYYEQNNKPRSSSPACASQRVLRAAPDHGSGIAIEETILNRISFAGVAGALVLAAALPLTCVAQPTPAAAPKPAGEIRIALDALANEVLDPKLGSTPTKIYLSMVYDYLVGATPDSKPDPRTGIANKWEVAHGKDSSTYTFHLRRGVKFHNGDELTAQDVKFSLQRMTSEQAQATTAGAVRKAIREIEVVDPYTIRVRTNGPYLWLVHDLSPIVGVEGMVLPKRYLEQVGDKEFALKPVGSGPYRFLSREMGSGIQLEAQDSHWRVGVPRYKNIKFRIVPEETTRVASLKRGEVDVIGLSGDSVKELKGDKFRIFSKPGVAMNGLWLTGASAADSPFRKKQVRQALNLAINRGEIRQQIFLGTGKPLGTWPISSWAIGYTETPLYPFDPVKAKALLKAAGYPNGLEVEMYSFAQRLAESKDINDAIAGYWKNIGITTKIIPTDYAAYRQKWQKRTLSGAALSGVHSVGGRLLPHTLFQETMHSKGALATHQIPKLDGLIDSVVQAQAIKEYETRMATLLRYMNDEYIFIPLLESDLYFATSNQITDWKFGTNSFDYDIEYLTSRKVETAAAKAPAERPARK